MLPFIPLATSLVDEMRFHNLIRSLHRGAEACDGLVPPGEFSGLYASLVCGHSLPSGPAKQLFSDTGSLHLMVASGSHVVFLDLLFRKFHSSIRLILFILLLFATDFKAPILRALLRRLLRPWLKSKCGFTSIQIEAATALIALAICPFWLTKESFVLSWMCGIAISTPRLSRILGRSGRSYSRSGGFLMRHAELAIKCYLAIAPIIWTSPLSIAWNTVLTPLVGFIQFPASALAMIFPSLTPATDLMWKGLLSLLAAGSLQPTAPHSLFFFLPRSWLFLVPLSVQSLLIVAEVKWRRAYAFF